MKAFALLALFVAASLLGNGCIRTGDPEQRQAKGVLICGSNTGLPPASARRMRRATGRSRRRPLPRRRGGDLRRPDQGAVRPAHRRGPLHRAPVGRGRRPVAQLDRTMSRDTAARPRVPGVNYYDGQGFMVRKDLGVDLGARSSTAPSVCIQTGHHHRAQPRRLLPRQRHDLPAGGFATRDEATAGLRRRPLRRLSPPTPRGLTPSALHPREPGRSRHPAGDHLEGAARAGGAPRRRPVGRHRALDASTPCSTPRSSA